jgi:hypothetical protein
MLNTIRTHWMRISAGLLLSGLLGVIAYDKLAEDDCCGPGQPCCYPGSPCCAHGAHAEATQR